MSGHPNCFAKIEASGKQNKSGKIISNYSA